MLGAGSRSRKLAAAKGGSCLLEVAGGHIWGHLLVSQPAWSCIWVSSPLVLSGPQASCISPVPHGAVSGAQRANTQEALGTGRRLGTLDTDAPTHLQAHGPLLILITILPTVTTTSPSPA